MYSHLQNYSHPYHPHQNHLHPSIYWNLFSTNESIRDKINVHKINYIYTRKCESIENMCACVWMRIHICTYKYIIFMYIWLHINTRSDTHTQTLRHIQINTSKFIHIYTRLDLKIKKWFAIFWSSPKNCQSLFKLIRNLFALYSLCIRNLTKVIRKDPKILRTSWLKWFSITPIVIRIWQCKSAYFQPCSHTYTHTHTHIYIYQCDFQ